MTKTEFKYKDAAGDVIGVITRIDTDDGEKSFRASAGFPKPRPLYGLDLLAARPGAPVLLTEGEGKCEAARILFPDFCVTTSPFGARSFPKADASPLSGREVTVWPDNDEAGRQYADDICAALPQVRVVDTSGFPEGWELADDLPEGMTDIDLRSRLVDAKAPGPSFGANKNKANGKATDDLRDKLRRSAEEAKAERDALIRKVVALIRLTVANGCTEAEEAAATTKAAELMGEYRIDPMELQGFAAVSDEDEEEIPELVELLAEIDDFMARFIIYPSKAARVAHTLWIVHTHLIECWYTTPRLAFMSAEKESGKTRALEVSELLVRSPVFSINVSPAAIVRIVSSGPATILYDEVDGVFGSAKLQEANADLRTVLNGGYRRGAKVIRCVKQGEKQVPEELEAFAPVAVAGLRNLPDTLASRAIIIRMQRRAPDERVKPFRYRYVKPHGVVLRGKIAARCKELEGKLTGAEPKMPDGIVDRNAECWEPLFAVADEAGGAWPKLARDAAIALTKGAADETQSRGVELLKDIREAFGEDEKLWASTLLDRLINRDESPWKDLSRGGGKERPLDDAGLRARLKPFGIKSKDIWLTGKTRKGYEAKTFYDVWNRYLSPVYRESHEDREEIDNKNKNLADLAAGGGEAKTKGEAAKAPLGARLGCCSGGGCPTCKPELYGMKPRPAGGYGPEGPRHTGAA